MTNQPPGGPWAAGPDPDPYGQQPGQYSPYHEQAWQQPGPYGGPGDFSQPTGQFSQPTGQDDPFGGQQGIPVQEPAWQPTPPRRGRRAVVLGAGAAAGVVVLGTAGIFAFNALSGGGAQPESAMPADTLAYVRLDLDPSAGQKINTLRLLNRIPEFKENANIGQDADLRRSVIDSFNSSSSCSLDYATAVEPWIGDRMGAAVLPAAAAGAEPGAVLVVQVRNGTSMSDIEPMRTQLNACGNSAGFALSGDYLVLGEDQSYVDAVVARTQQQSLAEDPQFSGDMKALGGSGIASFWVDVPQLQAAVTSSSALDGDTRAAMTQLDGVSSYYGALRAGDSYLELVVDASTTQEYEAPAGSNPVTRLPSDTMAAVSVSGGAANLDRAWEQVTRSAGYEVESTLADLEQSTGIALPADLKTLLGDNLTLAVSADGLTQATVERGDLSAVRVGARLTGDATAQQGVVDTVNSLLTDQGGPGLYTGSHRAGITVSTNRSYADQLAADGDLGRQQAFKDAVPDAERAVGVLYLDVDRATGVVSGFEDAAADPQVQDLLRSAEPVRAIGLTSFAPQNGRVHTVLRVTFDT